MPTHAPKKYLISHTSLQHCFDKSRSGLEKLRETDPSFSRPIKFGPSKQAGVYFVVAEVEAWLERKISDRDGVPLDLAGGSPTELGECLGNQGRFSYISTISKI